MEITITTRDATPEFEAKLLALLAEFGKNVTHVPDTRWTPERARAYYDRLPPRARQILLALVRNGGHIPVDRVRVDGGSLRGTTGPFRRILRAGAVANPPLWPAELPVPIRPVYSGGVLCRFDLGPSGPDDPFPAFREALIQVVRLEGDDAAGPVAPE